MCTHILCFEKKYMKCFFHLKIINFTDMKNCSILHRCVIVIFGIITHFLRHFQPGIFQAVEDHDIPRIKELIQCWCRVDCMRVGDSS